MPGVVGIQAVGAFRLADRCDPKRSRHTSRASGLHWSTNANGTRSCAGTSDSIQNPQGVTEGCGTAPHLIVETRAAGAENSTMKPGPILRDGSPGGEPAFTTTHWSVVLAAGQGDSPNAQVALEQLCRTYWYPLYAHVRRRGYNRYDAQDLTQEFFARLLAKRWMQAADRGRGRFRTFLLAALNHFLANEWDRGHCAKRGGDRPHLPFDTVAAENLYGLEAGHHLSADEVYEWSWALRFLDQVRTRLRSEYAAQGRADRFDLMERFLPGEPGSLSYAQAAAQLGIPEGTLKSDVHRLKKRYGQLLREEIAHIVAGPEEIDDELRHLIAVVGR
jgi:DNA-directed RNA polymerase specialized sigma24 family protein